MPRFREFPPLISACRTSLAALLLVLVAFAAAGQSQAGTPLAAFTVPFSLHHGDIYVDGTLNGKPAHFVLDTGASQIALTPEAVERFGLEPGKELGQSYGAGGAVDIRSAGKVTLGVGAALLEKQEAAVVPLPRIMKDCDGLLGAPFFRHFVVTFDYEHRLCGIGHDVAEVNAAIKTAVVAAEHQPANPSPEISLPLTFFSGVPLIDASLEGHHIHLMVDTGDGGCFNLYAPYVAREHLRDRFKAQMLTSTRKGVGGYMYCDVIRIPALDLGIGTKPTETVALQGLITSMWRKEGLGVISRFAEGQIGTQILKHFVVTFDYAHSRLRLVPGGQFADPFLYSRSGFSVDLQGDKYIVGDVVPSNPAALAGIQNGDVILSIDDISMNDLMAADDDKYAPFRQPVGTVVRVLRQRGGEPPVEAKVVLQDQL